MLRVATTCIHWFAGRVELVSVLTQLFDVAWGMASINLVLVYTKKFMPLIVAPFPLPMMS